MAKYILESSGDALDAYTRTCNSNRGTWTRRLWNGLVKLFSTFWKTYFMQTYPQMAHWIGILLILDVDKAFDKVHMEL